jgi:spore maturation protein CgeB
MMMAEYTDDLSELFEEGKEIEFFRGKNELLRKIKYYLDNEEECLNIGKEGNRRLLNDRHEVVDRCEEIIKIYEE